LDGFNPSSKEFLHYFFFIYQCTPNMAAPIDLPDSARMNEATKDFNWNPLAASMNIIKIDHCVNYSSHHKGVRSSSQNKNTDTQQWSTKSMQMRLSTSSSKIN
jgi:hypothetical protein